MVFGKMERLFIFKEYLGIFQKFDLLCCGILVVLEVEIKKGFLGRRLSQEKLEKFGLVGVLAVLFSLDKLWRIMVNLQLYNRHHYYRNQYIWVEARLINWYYFFREWCYFFRVSSCFSRLFLVFFSFLSSFFL